MASTTTTAFLTFALLFLLATTTTAATPIAPTTAPITQHHRAQESTIIDAIIGATDFNNWANLLASGDTTATTVPISATLFLPDNLNNNNNLPLASHVIPRSLTFSDLQLFPTGAHLPTLIPGTTLRITNNSAVNFTINASKLTKPDIYQNAVVSVHGVDGFLDGSHRGGGFNVSGVRSTRQSRLPKAPIVEVRPLPPAAVSAAVMGTGSMAVVAVLLLLVLYLLGFRVRLLNVVLVILIFLATAPVAAS